MWVDLLNTPVSQVPLTPDEFGDTLPLHHRSSASSTPRLRALVQPPLTQSLYPLHTSDIKIGLVLNSSASTGGKLLGTNPSGGQGRMPHPQWMYLSPRVRLELRRR
jgi:hypothetical protein